MIEISLICLCILIACLTSYAVGVNVGKRRWPQGEYYRGFEDGVQHERKQAAMRGTAPWDQSRN